MTTETVILSQLSENKANPRKITEDKNYPMASRIIKDTLEAKLIKEGKRTLREATDITISHIGHKPCNYHVTERLKNISKMAQSSIK